LDILDTSIQFIPIHCAYFSISGICDFLSALVGLYRKNFNISKRNQFKNSATKYDFSVHVNEFDKKTNNTLACVESQTLVEKNYEFLKGNFHNLEFICLNVLNLVK
jgi:hypothetical protein